MLKYEVLGTTDERTECDCCGKYNLKRTVALEDRETHEIVFFGTSCAAQAQGWTLKETKATAKTAQDEKEEAARRKQRARERAATDRWFAFLDRATNGESRDFGNKLDVAHAINRLGGYAAARAAYKAA